MASQLPNDIILRMTPLPLFPRLDKLSLEALSWWLVMIERTRTHEFGDDAETS
jgi:hypothetical protein